MWQVWWYASWWYYILMYYTICTFSCSIVCFSYFAMLIAQKPLSNPLPNLFLLASPASSYSSVQCPRNVLVVSTFECLRQVVPVGTVSSLYREAAQRRQLDFLHDTRHFMIVLLVLMVNNEADDDMYVASADDINHIFPDSVYPRVLLLREQVSYVFLLSNVIMLWLV